jgi:excisionase family DNA binding protein
MFYTLDEVSEILKLNRQTVKKLLQDEVIRGIRIGRSYRISDQEVNRLLESGFVRKNAGVLN